MLPGKVYTPEDFLRILGRRMWLVLVPFAVVAAGTAVYARYLPDRFRSDTVIMVVPQRVPESYVRSMSTSRIEDRLNSIGNQILSRARLERIVEEYNLYADLRRTGIMEDIIQKMRERDIRISIQGAESFRVSFEGENPRTVQKVAERLASLFIEESVRDRSVLVEGASQFIESQLEDARRRLVEHEKKLETYRREFSGQLPSQLESNNQALNATQSQINGMTESLNRDSDRQLQFEQRLAELEDGVVPDSALGVGPAQTAVTRELAAAKAALEDYEARLKPDHPNLKSIRRKVAELQARADAEAASGPVSATDSTSSARAQQIERVRAEVAQLNKQMAQKKEELKRLRAQASTYLARVEGVPARESDMLELMRDYSTLQNTYNSLAAKREDSKLSANLEQRQIGEQFRMLDPARLPQKPFSPDRQRLNMMGMAAGLVIGLLLVAFLEYRDKTFKTDEEVSNVLSLPVLAVVPLLQSTAERKRNFRAMLLLHLGCGATVALCLAVVTYTFVR